MGKKAGKHSKVRAWDGRIGGTGGFNIFAKHAIAQPCDVCKSTSDMVIYDLRNYEYDGTAQKWYLCTGCIRAYWTV